MSHVNHLAGSNRSRTLADQYSRPVVGTLAVIHPQQLTSRVKVQLHLRIVLHAHYCQWLYGPGTVVILCDLFIIEAVDDDGRTVAVGGRMRETDSVGTVKLFWVI